MARNQKSREAQRATQPPRWKRPLSFLDEVTGLDLFDVLTAPSRDEATFREAIDAWLHTDPDLRLYFLARMDAFKLRLMDEERRRLDRIEDHLHSVRVGTRLMVQLLKRQGLAVEVTDDEVEEAAPRALRSRPAREVENEDEDEDEVDEADVGDEEGGDLDFIGLDANEQAVARAAFGALDRMPRSRGKQQVQEEVEETEEGAEVDAGGEEEETAVVDAAIAAIGTPPAEEDVAAAIAEYNAKQAEIEAAAARKAEREAKGRTGRKVRAKGGDNGGGRESIDPAGVVLEDGEEVQPNA
jgi:hypothetical protein